MIIHAREEGSVWKRTEDTFASKSSNVHLNCKNFIPKKINSADALHGLKVRNVRSE